MASLRPRSAAALVVLLFAAAVGLVTWLTREPAPERARPAEGAPSPEVAAPRARPPAAAAPAAPGACPPERSGEVYPGAGFSEPWAMCRLFGNHDPDRGTSRLPGAVARVVLSRGFTDPPAERHALVIAREAAADDGAVIQGRGAAASLTAYVFERGAAGWRLVTSGGVGGPYEPGQLPRLEVIRVGPARHGLLAGGVLPGQASLYALSEEGIPVLIAGVPTGGTNAGLCQPPRCFAWKAELSFARGRDPDYDDAVFRVTGTRPDDDERVWPVDETHRWVRRGGRYVPQP